MRAMPSIDAPADKAQKGPFLGPFRCKPNGNPIERLSPLKNAKKRHLRRHTRNEDETHACLFPPRGESGVNLGELLATFARMKIIRSHRSGWRVEFSFGVTSDKNYYVNSRVKNEETSAFETN